MDQEWLTQEYEQVKHWTAKLSAFLIDNPKLPTEERFVLDTQLDVMTTYLNILEHRIESATTKIR